MPRPAAPIRVAPAIGARIDDQARAVHVVGLRARGRVGHQLARRRAGSGSARRRRTRASASNQPSRAGRIGAGAAVDLERDRARRRRPEPEARAPVVQGARASGCLRSVMPAAAPRSSEHDAAAPTGRCLLADDVALRARPASALSISTRVGSAAAAALNARSSALGLTAGQDASRCRRRRRGAAQGQGPLLRVVPGIAATSLAPCASNQAMSRMPGAGFALPCRKSAERSTEARGAARSGARRKRAGPRLRRLGLLPVEPGDLVVLAIGVVVAVLRAAELVAGQQHRRAVRERTGGQQRALQRGSASR